MSNYEQRDMTGRLFRNEEKKNPNGPDYSGTCVINGEEMYFDGWLKTAESGRKWMSFSFKPKQQQSKPQTHGEMKRGTRRNDDDAAPW